MPDKLRSSEENSTSRVQDLFANPFKGLDSYSEDDADFFFGRVYYIDKIFDSLRNERMTILHGQSGVGKSSILRAGVTSIFNQETKQQLQLSRTPKSLVFIFPFLDASHPWTGNLVTKLLNLIEEKLKKIEGELNKNREPSIRNLLSWHEIKKSYFSGDDYLNNRSEEEQNIDRPQFLLTSALQVWTKWLGDGERSGKIFIILDQFEEYFLEKHIEKHSKNDNLIPTLIEILGNDRLPVNLLLATRSDSLNQIDRHFKGSGSRIDKLIDNRIELECLTKKNAKEAVIGTIRTYNKKLSLTHNKYYREKKLGYDLELVDEVLTKVSSTRDSRFKNVPIKFWTTLLDINCLVGILFIHESQSSSEDYIEASYLQLVMKRLWEWEIDAKSKRLQLETLNKLGDAKGVVKDHLEEQLNRLSQREKEIVTQIFYYLVTPSGAKIAHTVYDLVKYANDNLTSDQKPLETKEVKNLLDKLSQGDSRILRRVAGDRYEIFFDILARAVLEWVYKKRKSQGFEIGAREFMEWVKLQGSFQGFSQGFETGAKAALEWVQSQGLNAQGFETVAQNWIAQKLKSQEFDTEIETHKFKQSQTIYLAQSSIIKALQLTLTQERKRQSEEYDLSALLACQAYWFNQKSKISILEVVDRALREILKISYFAPILSGHRKTVTVVAISQDNQTVASGSDDETVRLWNLRQPYDAPQVLKSHQGRITSVALSRDGKVLAAGSQNGTIQLWNLSPPDNIPRFLGGQNGHRDEVRSVAFSSDGKWLASGSWDNTVRLWDWSKPNPEPIVLLDPPQDHPLKDYQILSVAFSLEEKLLAAGRRDGRIWLWDFESSKFENNNPQIFELYKNNNYFQKELFSVALSCDGSKLAAGGSEGFQIWDVCNSSKYPINQKKTSGVRAIAFSPDGKMLASGNDNRTIQLWNLEQHDREPAILKGHKSEVRSIAFSPNGKMLASGSRNAKVRLWELEQPSLSCLVLPRHESQDRHSFEIRAVAYSTDGRTIASGGCDNTVRLWDLSKPDADPMTLPDSYHDGNSLAFSPDGKLLAATAYGQEDAGILSSVRIWDLRQPMAKPTILCGHDGDIWAIAFSPDGKVIASGSWDKTIRLWNLNQLDADPIVLEGHEGAVRSLAFSADSTKLASGSWDGISENCDRTVRLWDLTSDHPIPTILKEAHCGETFSVAFSPDGKWLASVGKANDKSKANEKVNTDNTVRLWNLDQLDKPKRFEGLNFEGSSLAFISNSQLAAGSWTKTIWLWNVNDINSRPTILSGHKQGVNSIAFSPDSQCLASASDDNTIRIWVLNTRKLAGMVCEKVSRNLSQQEWDEFVGADIPYERTCPNLPSGEGARPDAPAANAGEPLETPNVPPVSSENFEYKFAKLLPEHKEILDFIKPRDSQEKDKSEEDVTTKFERDKGDPKTYLQLETLRLLGFLKITDQGFGPGTIRYGLSPQYQEYLETNLVKAN